MLVALGGLEFGPVAAVVVGAPEGRRYPHPGVPGAGRLLVVASLLEYHREALRRRRILHVPLPKLGQRPALVLQMEKKSPITTQTKFEERVGERTRGTRTIGVMVAERRE